MSWILYVLLVLAVAGDILLAVVLAKVMHKNDEPQQKIDTADDFVRAVTPVLQSETDLLAEQLRAMQGESARTTTATLRDFSAVLAENQRQNAAASTARLESIDRAGAARQKAANDALLAQLTMMETRLKNLEDSNATRMDSVRGALVQGLNTIRADNNKKLDEIRGTVEEKLQDTLQQRINDSFKTVSAQLEQVYKGLGEMQNLAADVGSLKQVLSGVKTRGILGEVQLGAILEQILAPGQYACNIATVPGSTNRVEYAIKMPGQNGTVWLPIDAKFPGDTYAHLQAAQERGDAAAAAAMRKALNNVLRAEARDIHDKYIEVPYTTSFGILFLPFLSNDYAVSLNILAAAGWKLVMLALFYLVVTTYAHCRTKLLVGISLAYALPRFGLFVGQNVAQLLGVGSTADFVRTTAVAFFLLYLILMVIWMVNSHERKRAESQARAADELLGRFAQEQESVRKLRCDALADDHGLTNREKDILYLLAQGRDLAFICETLFLSKNTVKSYQKTIYAKLNVHSKQEIIDLVHGELDGSRR